MTKHITITLTEDQANAIWRTLEYGMADPYEDLTGSKVVMRYDPEDKKYNAFLERIRVKIAKELAKAKTS